MTGVYHRLMIAMPDDVRGSGSAARLADVLSTSVVLPDGDGERVPADGCYDHNGAILDGACLD